LSSFGRIAERRSEEINTSLPYPFIPPQTASVPSFSNLYGLKASQLGSLGAMMPGSPFSMYPPYIFMGFPLQPLMPPPYSSGGNTNNNIGKETTTTPSKLSGSFSGASDEYGGSRGRIEGKTDDHCTSTANLRPTESFHSTKKHHKSSSHQTGGQSGSGGGSRDGSSSSGGHNVQHQQKVKKNQDGGESMTSSPSHDFVSPLSFSSPMDLYRSIQAGNTLQDLMRFSAVGSAMLSPPTAGSEAAAFGGGSEVGGLLARSMAGMNGSASSLANAARFLNASMNSVAGFPIPTNREVGGSRSSLGQHEGHKSRRSHKRSRERDGMNGGGGGGGGVRRSEPLAPAQGYDEYGALDLTKK